MLPLIADPYYHHSPVEPHSRTDDFAAAILAWYDRARRDLPWRSPPGVAPDPYHVWLSEIMLQQTTVATVGPYYHAFLARWPDVGRLAAAPLDDVLHGWQGLGYYARARNLHKCAGAIVAQHGGRFPADEAALRALPGIGPYTAAAIAAIAFDRPATPVDGNVERVIARLFAVADPLPGAKRQLRDLAAELPPARRPGDYVQAVMDLGATICTPRNPKCGLCPWRGGCAAAAAGIAEDLPRRAARPNRPRRRGIAFWVRRADGAVLLRRRPERGLLGGMMEVPSTEWRAQPWPRADALALAPVAAAWRMLPGVVRHTFTHFDLELRVAMGTPTAGGQDTDGDEIWVALDALSGQALPTVMKKVIDHALGRPDQNEMRPVRKST